MGVIIFFLPPTTNPRALRSRVAHSDPRSGVHDDPARRRDGEDGLAGAWVSDVDLAIDPDRPAKGDLERARRRLVDRAQNTLGHVDRGGQVLGRGEGRVDSGVNDDFGDVVLHDPSLQQSPGTFTVLPPFPTTLELPECAP